MRASATTRKRVDYPGVEDCPFCKRPPLVEEGSNGFLLFGCCGSSPRDSIEWNLYTQKHQGDGEVDGEVEPAPEEDEAFEELERKLNPEPEWPLASMGRSIERFGKLLQDRNSTVVDLVEAARSAGFNLRVGIQPEVEETTDEREPEHQ